MPRDGTETYVLPFPDVVEDTTIESPVYNGFTSDVAQDLNTPRPIKFGGTGAANVTDAMTNLGGELAKQVVTNYDSAVLIPGSFYSASTATAAPISGHAFSGICYLTDTNNMFLEASDQDDSTQPGAKYIRQKKAGVWSLWQKIAGVSTGTTPPVGASDNSLWWDPTLGKLFVYYNDGNTKQWVETNAVPDVDPNTYVEITGDIMTGPLTLNANPTVGLHAAPKQYVDAAVAVPLRGWIAGLTLSTPGASNNFSVTIGETADSTGVALMRLTSAYTKTYGTWALGSGGGGLDTGAAAPSTWYHAYLIKRPDTGVVDVLISLSSTAPTLPANYTLFRRIGSMRINASGQFIKFIQDGDTFTWDTPVFDVSATNPGIAAVTRSVTTPPGIRTEALLTVYLVAAAVSDCPGSVYISDLSVADIAPLSNAAVTIGMYNGASVTSMQMGWPVRVFTGTANNFRSRLQISAAGTQINIFTNGWIDRRGRDA